MHFCTGKPRFLLALLCFWLCKKQGLTFCLQNVMQKCLFVQQNALAREVFRGEKSGGRKKKRRKIALPKYIFAPGQNDYTHAPFGRLRGAPWLHFAVQKCSAKCLHHNCYGL